MNTRLAKPADADAIAKIHVEAWHATYSGIIPADDLASMTYAKQSVIWKRRLEGEKAVTLVIESDGDVSGWLSFGPSRDPGSPQSTEIYGLYIAPQKRRSKLGTRLLESMWSYVQEGDVTLWVLAQNLPAIRFYERMGFDGDGAEKEAVFGTAKLVERRFAKRAQR